MHTHARNFTLAARAVGDAAPGFVLGVDVRVVEADVDGGRGGGHDGEAHEPVLVARAFALLVVRACRERPGGWRVEDTSARDKESGGGREGGSERGGEKVRGKEGRRRERGKESHREQHKECEPPAMFPIVRR